MHNVLQNIIKYNWILLLDYIQLSCIFLCINHTNFYLYRKLNTFWLFYRNAI